MEKNERLIVPKYLQLEAARIRDEKESIKMFMELCISKRVGKTLLKTSIENREKDRQWWKDVIDALNIESGKMSYNYSSGEVTTI